jgi:predicted amidohydrolase YtcJ
VYLARTDCHSAVASSALLALTPEVRSDSGWVREEEHGVVRKAAFAGLPLSQRRDAQRALRTHAASLGIACLHECGGPGIDGEDDFVALLALAREEPGPEVLGYWGELGGVARARELGAVAAGGDLFADGSIGSHTACLHRRYDDADTTGYAYVTAEQVTEHVVACTRAGLQGGFHAIGDAALTAVVEGYAAAAEQVGLDVLRAARHRIEHVEVPLPEHIAEMGRLGLVASVQPVFDARWGGRGGLYEARLGWERTRDSNPLAALAAAGVPLAFGSDSPVTPLDPWGAVRAAVQHHTPGSRLSARPRSARTRAAAGGRRDATTRGSSPPGRRRPSPCGTCRGSWSCRRRTTGSPAGRPTRGRAWPVCRTCPGRTRSAGAPSCAGARSGAHERELIKA